MSFSNCVSIVGRMDQRDQDAVLAYLDFHLKAGMNPKDAQRLAVQDAIKGLDREEGATGNDAPAESGAPAIRTADVTLDFAEPTERMEFIPTADNQAMYNMAIMSPNGEYQGTVEVLFIDGSPHTLYDIWLDTDKQRSGYGTKTVKALLDASVGGKLEISNIVPEAQDFWAKLGIGVQNHGQGAAYDGTITSESFNASDANSDARRAGRMGRGNPQARREGQVGETQFSERDQTETPEFKRWSGGAPVAKIGEKHSFKSGQPVVAEALHGTTNADLTEFKRSRASISSDFGAGFYASNSASDVATNYANVDGPDLTQRVELLAEQLEQDDDFEGGHDEAVRLARAKLSDSAPNTLKLFVRFKNPAVLGGKGETYFDYTEEYNEDTDSYSEPTGLLVDFVNALDDANDGIDVYARDLEGVKSKLFDAAQGDGVKFAQLTSIVKEGLIDASSNEDGGSASSEVLRQALAGMGFDGVIDTTVADKFGPRVVRGGQSYDRAGGMKGMTKDTVHFIAFEPNQLKSAIGNNGEFDDGQNDILRSEREAISAGADAIKAMSEDERDNLEPAKAPGGWAAYVLYEARKIMPKPSDKLKKLTERNSFIAHQDNEYLANVDGAYYGVNKWEDPDATGDEEEGREPFVYAFHSLEDRGLNTINSMESDVPELMAAIRASKAKLNLSERVIQEEQDDDKNGNFYTELRKRLGSGGSGNYPGSLLYAAFLGLERPGVHLRQAIERHDSGRGDGSTIVRWTDSTPLKDYFTTGLKGRTQKGESGFYMPIVPAKYVGSSPKNQDLLNAILNGRAATVVEIHNLSNGSIEIAIRGPQPGGQFHLENDELTKPTGLIDPDGVEHLQVPVGPSAARSFIREALRRYAMLHGGSLPDVVMARSTGANPSLKEKAKPGSEMEARYSIRAGTSAWGEPTPSRFDDFVYKAQDKMIDVKRVVESISKSVGRVADGINVYLQEELFHGRAAKRTQDFAQQELQPLMESMAADGLTIGDVEEYLHARHAQEANTLIAGREPSMPDGGSGMTNAAAAAYLASIPAAQLQKLNDAARQVDAILAKTRQMYADYGLESQQTVDDWAQMFQHYVPLQREDKEGSMGIGQGFSVKGKEVKGRTGSTRRVVDILANVAMQRERLVVRGEKNRVSQALLGLAVANPNPDFWTVGSPPKERVYDPKTNTVVERIDPMYKSRDNVLVAKVRQANGAVVEMAVNFNEEDPRALRMAQSLKNLDAGNLEGLLGVSAKITRYFAAVNTQYNPVFGVVNLIRDVQGAMVNLAGTPLAGQQAKIAKDTISALAGIYSDIRAERKGRPATSQWAQLFEEFQKEGGQTGFRDLFKSSADRADQLQSILTPHGWMDSGWGKIFTANGTLKVPMAQAQKGAGFIFGWLSDYNDAMENGVRLASYKAAIDSGMSKQQAASLAKNLTVNFNRKGQVGQQAGAVFAFFNAAMQGSARLAQTLFDMDGSDPRTIRLSSLGKKVVYGGMLIGATQALALAAAGFDDEDPPEFLRERSLIIPTGGKTYVTIPMPLGLHVIPGLGRHATEFALSGFKKPAHRAVSLIGMFADAFNPIGNAGLSMQTLAPTALDPLVALTENKDWTGKPIARVSSNKAIPGFTQWKDTATAPAKLLAEGINWMSGGNEYVAGVLSPTPDQIDYLFAQVTGGVGRELAKVEQTAKAAVQGEDLPTFKIPLVGRFIGNSASQASQSGAFYANVNKLNELETEVKGLRKDGRFAEATALLRSRPDAYLQQQANVAERQIQRLRREKRELIKNNAPREAVKAKETQITAVMTRLNLAAEKISG